PSPEGPAKNALLENRDLRVKIASGEELPIKLSLNPLPYSDTVYTLATLHDLSWLRKTENALRLTEATYQSAIETSQDSFLLLDMDGLILEGNDEFCQRAGCSREDLKGMNVRQLIFPQTITRLGTPYAVEMLTDKQNSMFKAKLRYKNDTSWYAEIKKTYWPMQGGRIFVFIRDLTDQLVTMRKLRENRRKMLGLLKKQVASQTAAAIAHELNQPLNAISTYSTAALTILKSENPSSKKLETAIAGSAEQALRAGRVVKELLAFLTFGEVPQENLDLNQAVLDALEYVDYDGFAGFAAVLEFDPDLPPVRGNRIQIQKVLTNLLFNSIEAAHEAGISSTALTIRLKTFKSAPMAQFTIRDNGPGISSEVAQHLFEPFVTSKSNGTGFGVYVSRTLIESMGGRLWADFGDGSGAAFHFTLPLAAPL
ncbi:MAG TPA: ATP-binding protein, partial [Methylophilaceae bacterium]|nr:ATP-binding protein [Methylophilaceae bacterium]